MNIENVSLEKTELQKLLGAANGDAALLHLYIRCGNDPQQAAKALGLSEARFSCAAATLRQLGLWPEERRNAVPAGDRPAYSENDVIKALDTDKPFRLLYGEVQRLLGRTLNTEELKILLSFVRYLGLPAEVISVLVSYCKDRARQKGNLRNPSLRTIEKEAYFWAEQGIDTLAEAAAYIHSQNQRSSRMAQLMKLLQIRGRNLTPAEEKYAQGWLDMGFSDEVIAMAYERTCLNTGSLSWPYMNKILSSWHAGGMKTPEQIRHTDRKPDTGSGQRQLDAEERAAIARMMQEV